MLEFVKTEWVYLTCQNEITCKRNLEISSQQIGENSEYLYNKHIHCQEL